MKSKEKYSLCPKFEKTFSILGKKWNGLIIDVLLNEGSQRFKDLAYKVDKCSERVMVERLKELEDEGIVEKIHRCDSCRMFYKLTEQGQDLKKVMKLIHRWSEKWYDEPCN